MKKNLVIFGAGGHANSCIDVIKELSIPPERKDPTGQSAIIVFFTASSIISFNFLFA